MAVEAQGKTPEVSSFSRAWSWSGHTFALRYARNGLIGLVVLLLLAWLALPLILGPYLKHKLEDMARVHLNASLKIADLVYAPPYSVTVHGVELTMPDPQGGEDILLLKISGIHLTLDKLPVGSGPLLIRSLEIAQPEFHVVQMASGEIAAEHGLVRKEPDRQNEAAVPLDKKVSDYFRLRHFGVSNLSVVWEDRRKGKGPSVVWSDLNANAELRPKSTADYDVSFKASNKFLAELSLSAGINVDTGLLKVSNMQINGECGGKDAPGQMPPQFQEIIRQTDARGKLAFNASAVLPFNDLGSAHYEAQVAFSGGTAHVDALRSRLENLNFTINCSGAGKKTDFRLKDFGAVVDGVTVGIDHEARGSLDEADWRWTFAGMAGTARVTNPQLLEAAVPQLRKPDGTIQFSIAGSGPIPARADQTSYAVDIKTDNTSLAIPQLHTVFDKISANVHSVIESRCSDIHIHQLSALVPGGVLSLSDNSLVMLDAEHQRWKIDQLAGAIQIDDASKLPLAALARQRASGKLYFSATGAGDIPARGDADVWHVLGSLDDNTQLSYWTDVSHKLSACPPGFSQDVSLATSGMISVARRQLTIKGPTIQYGLESLRLNNAVVDLQALQNNVWRVDGLDARVHLVDPCPAVPGPLGQLLSTYRPGGDGQAKGWLIYTPGRPMNDAFNFALESRVENGEVRITKHHMPLTQISFTAQADRAKAAAQNVHFAVAGGSGLVDGAQIDLGGSHAFAGSASFKEIDLAQVRQMLVIDDPKHHMSGKLGGKVAANGSLPRGGEKLIDLVQARGEMQVVDGNFAQLPVVSEIASLVLGRYDEAGTVGEAAATFTIRGGSVHLSQAAASSPMLGVQGSGDISPEGKLLLHAVAAPLGDWKKKFNQSGIPLIGDIAGGVQSILNTASSQLLYEFKVDGTLDKPHVSAVPGAAISNGGAMLFGSMLNPANDVGKLMDGIKKLGD